MASFSVGVLIGPAIGATLSATMAAYLACGFGLLCVAYTFFLVPESLSSASLSEVRN